MIDDPERKAKKSKNATWEKIVNDRALVTCCAWRNRRKPGFPRRINGEANALEICRFVPYVGLEMLNQLGIFLGNEMLSMRNPMSLRLL